MKPLSDCKSTTFFEIIKNTEHGFLIKKDRFPKNRIFRLKNILK
jgi:hypothetical protein